MQISLQSCYRSEEVSRANNGIKYVGDRLNTQKKVTTDSNDEPEKEKANLFVKGKNQNIGRSKYTPLDHETSVLTWLPSLVGVVLGPGSVCILAVLLILKRTVSCQQRPRYCQEIHVNNLLFDESSTFHDVYTTKS